MIPWKFKGKARQVEETEGDGGQDGIVLPLQVVQTDVYYVAYTIEVSVGEKGQNLYLQVDTGSSDLWIASKSCSSSACGQANGHLYDPSSSTSTGDTFNIEYLQGNVSGPIVWDNFVVGGYSIENQALSAANTITSEPLGPNFSGIMGLALPLNSIIASLISPTTSNSPDGAAWASNLFSITPTSSAPSSRFISLLLSRPGSDDVPAQIGIGRHPEYVSDPGKVQYAGLESEKAGTLYWKVQVRAITAWVGGVEKPINIGRSNDGEVFPSAVLDSGVPLILTTTQVANAIYGAIGVGPASDGNYYVPCTTPLNITITLDNRDPIPIHPLDLTSEPSDTTTAASCIGLIQPADSVLAQADAGVGDIILGVPFLRNTYSVMAYEPPNTDGSFPVSTTNNNSNSGSAAGDIKPRLGLLGLTDPTTALDEFNTVRVLNKPISSSGSSGSSSNSSSSSGTVGKHLSVGIIVLVSLLGLFAACIALFGIRWFLTRRRFRRGLGPGSEEGVAAGGAGAASAALAGIGRATGTKEKDGDGGYKYALASTRGSRDLGKGGKPEIIELELELGKRPARPGKELYVDEETMRSGYEAYMQDHGLLDLGLGSQNKSIHDREEVRDHDAGWGDDTLVGGRGVVRPESGHERSLSVGVPLLHEIDIERTPSGSGSSSTQSQNRTRSVVDEFGARHSASLSISDDDDDLGLAGQRTSMAGVGTAGRSGRLSGGSTMPISMSMGMAAEGLGDRERTISVGRGGTGEGDATTTTTTTTARVDSSTRR